ncbi:hypothetical protein U14_03934 [Candidatus Moduliflexus flocculans]|uniref:Outer membrane efflux protein n=1 Tax=Candidatus Moduliflexus flocculans TaxID=1499966 RepID=A0A0S6VZL1_9BACT|nr:hypothetical protein U14_03934 [Candidatus Moduliflexus flocculans]
MKILQRSFWGIALSLTIVSAQYSFAQDAPSQEVPQVSEQEAQQAADSTTSEIQGMPTEREQVYFTIQDIIALSLKNNLDISVKKIDPKVVDEEIINAEAVFDTNSEANATYKFNEADSDNAPTGVMGASAGVNKQSQSGRFYSATFGFEGTNYNSDSQLNDAYTTALKLEAVQPLMKNRGKDVNTTQIRIKQKQRDISLSQLNSQVISVISDVMGAYWDLVNSRADLEAKRMSLKLANDLVKINEAQVEVGTLAPIEVLAAKAQAASRAVSVTAAELDVQTKEDQLKKLLGLPSDDSIWEAAIIPTDPPQVNAYGVTLEDNIQSALANREELKQAKTGIEIQQISLAYLENQLKPELNLIGGAGLVGANKEDEGIGDSFQSIFRADSFNVSVGGKFTYPLGNRAAQSAYNKAKLGLDQQQLSLQNLEQNLAVQVRINYRNVQTAYELIGSTRVARQLAQEQLDAEQKKFNEGLSTNFQVLDYQDQLTQAITNEALAVAAYNKAIVNLESTTGITLQHYNIVVEP